MDDYLAKPFRPEDLARILRRHLGKAPAAGRHGLAAEAGAAASLMSEPPAATRLSMG
jgi:DNA-binding response OmpR family regulator